MSSFINDARGNQPNSENTVKESMFRIILQELDVTIDLIQGGDFFNVFKLVHTMVYFLVCNI